jgi:hypothetical protein
MYGDCLKNVLIYEDHLLGYEPAYSGRCLPTFRKNIQSPASALKTEIARSSEISVNIDQTVRRHIPEDINFHSYRRENLNFHKPNLCAWSQQLMYTQSNLFIILYSLALFYSSLFVSYYLECRSPMHRSLCEDTVSVPYLCLLFPLSVDATQIVEALSLVTGTPRCKLSS